MRMVTTDCVKKGYINRSFKFQLPGILTVFNILHFYSKSESAYESRIKSWFKILVVRYKNKITWCLKTVLSLTMTILHSSLCNPSLLLHRNQPNRHFCKSLKIWMEMFTA